jgi:tetratricopeptide (TPR) repeat protein
MEEAAKPDTHSAEVKNEASSGRSQWRARLMRLRGPIVAVAAVGTVLGGLAGYWNGWRAVRSGMTEVSASAPQLSGPVVPFSAADRRMTFAVLPFQAPAGDADGARLALAAAEVLQSAQESKTVWARVVPRPLVEQQAARPQTLNQLGRALDVHFLLRGSVVRSEPGHALELSVVDVATERVLHQRTIKLDAAAGGAQVPVKAIQDEAGLLTYYALTQEVARARDKPDALLDVRDLAFRAKVDWATDSVDRAGVYATVMKSLNRALALAPDDPLTLMLTAQINLCECLRTWAADDRPMEEIGIKALDQALSLRPGWGDVLGLRFWHHLRHSRFQDALLVNDTLFATDPEDADVLQGRVIALSSLGEVGQALVLVPKMLKAADDESSQSIAAAVYFASGDDAQAALLARKALVHMTRNQRADSGPGSAALVLVAAESRAGRLDQARKAFSEFQQAVPNVKTVAQIKTWLRPYWVPPGGDVFWQALRNAGAEG